MITDTTDHKLPSAEDEPTISVPRGGRAYGLGRSASYAAAKAGVLPTIRVGGKLLVVTALLRKQLGLDPA